MAVERREHGDRIKKYVIIYAFEGQLAVAHLLALKRIYRTKPYMSRQPSFKG
jgi:hypothetical protein